MKTFIIDRSKWIRGCYDGNRQQASSVLANENNQYCCLGQIALQCGVPIAELVDIETPADVAVDDGKYPDFDALIANKDNVADEMMVANDNSYDEGVIRAIEDGTADRIALDASRECRLKDLAKSLDWDLVFIDKAETTAAQPV